MIKGGFLSPFTTVCRYYNWFSYRNQPLLRLSHRARPGHPFLGSRRRKDQWNMLLLWKRLWRTRRGRNEGDQIFCWVVKWTIFSPYRRDNSNLSRKTVRTGFAVSRLQKPRNIKSVRWIFEQSNSFHEFQERKHAPRRIPKVKLELALLDEFAKHPKIKSEMSAKNKRNIFVRLLC